MIEPARSASLATISVASTNEDRRVVTRSMWAGACIWPTFLLLDAYMCFVVYPAAPFALFVIYRVVIEMVFLIVYRTSLRPDADANRLFRSLSTTYSATALTIAMMAIHLGGIVSPYMHGISIVALVWAALVPVHWRRALPTFWKIGLSFPLVMGVGAAVSPSARAAWIKADAIILFAAN